MFTKRQILLISLSVLSLLGLIGWKVNGFYERRRGIADVARLMGPETALSVYWAASLRGDESAVEVLTDSVSGRCPGEPETMEYEWMDEVSAGPMNSFSDYVRRQPFGGPPPSKKISAPLWQNSKLIYVDRIPLSRLDVRAVAVGERFAVYRLTAKPGNYPAVKEVRLIRTAEGWRVAVIAFSDGESDAAPLYDVSRSEPCLQ